MKHLRALVPDGVLSSEATYYGERSWAMAHRDLCRIADRKLCSFEDWSWPDDHPLWIDAHLHQSLSWALGHDIPELAGRKRPVPRG